MNGASTIVMVKNIEGTSNEGTSNELKGEVDPADVEALLAHELNSLSLQERGALYEEIHGVDRDVEETEVFLQERIAALEFQLKLLVARKQADTYERALAQSEAYVTNRKFRLMFLRAEYFEPPQAAFRLIRFLELKVKFFGEDALGRRILLSDMDRDDLACLKLGKLQILSARDRRGRTVIADMNMDSSFRPKSIDNMIKSFLYLVCAAAEDEETQRCGIVLLFYFSTALDLAQDLHKREPAMFECVPIKMVGLHFCTNDSRMRIVKAVFMLIFGRQLRVKVRFHEGSHTEVQYSLMAFGLPVDSLPATYKGELKTAAHHKWIARRYIKEENFRKNGEHSIFEGIDLPGPRDVLLGRGKTVQDARGNLKLKYVVLTHLEEYKSAAKLDKNGVAMKLVRRTKEDGGRFLKRVNGNGVWIEVDSDAAREKVSTTFRATISALGKTSEPNFVQQENGKRPRIEQ